MSTERPFAVGLFVVIVLPYALAGCLWQTPIEATVPWPRIGDRVEFDVVREVEGYPPLEQHVTIRLEKNGVVVLPTGDRVDAVDVAFWANDTANDRAKEGHFQILSDSSSLITSMMECDRHNGECLPQEQVFLTSPRPWGFGASIFQGRTFQSDQPEGLELALEGEPLPLVVEVLDGASKRDLSQATVRISTESGAEVPPTLTHSFVTGVFGISSANPYTMSAHVEYREWFEVLGEHRNTTIAVSQTHYRAGHGVPVVRSLDRPESIQCLPTAGPFSRGLPPGSDVVVPPLDTSFAEFLEHVVERNESLDAYLASPGSFVENIWFTGKGAEASQAGILTYRTHAARIDVLAKPGELAIVTLVRHENATPLGSTTSYQVTGEGGRTTVLDMQAVHGMVVSTEDLLRHHFDAENGTAELPYYVLLQVENGGHTLRPYLKLTYGSMNEIEYKYDLRSGCLELYKGPM